MLKIIKPAAALLLVAVALILLDHIFMPKYIDENQDGRITREFYTQADDPDVVFMGSSTVHYCVSPDYMWSRYGFTSYDRSNASQTLWQSYYILKDTLAFCRPALVALDLGFIKNGEEFVEEPSNRKAIESMRDPAAKLGAVLSSAGDFEQPLSYFIPVLRYHSRWKELTKDDFKYAFDSERVTYDGYLMDFTIAPEQHIYEREPIEEIDFAPKATEYLDRIISLCESEGVPLLLMRTPVFVNTWHEEYDKELRSLAKERGLTYVNFTDYSDDMELKVRTDYLDDGEHTNVIGAHKFSDFLGKYITEHYTLPSHDSDTQLKKVWQEKLEEYDAAFEKGMPLYQEAYNALADEK